jgi:hypothetical protein
MRYHREVALPDIERIVDERIDSRFDSVDKRFDQMMSKLNGLRQEIRSVADLESRL